MKTVFSESYESEENMVDTPILASVLIRISPEQGIQDVEQFIKTHKLPKPVRELLREIIDRSV
jgi:hypothetical protein